MNHVFVWTLHDVLTIVAATLLVTGFITLYLIEKVVLLLKWRKK